jgi:hypothetical protein
MHHPSGNPLRRFAREAGVECHPGDPLPTLSAFDVGWSHLVLFPPDPAEPAAWVFDLDAFGSGPILVCHVFHSATGRILFAGEHTQSARVGYADGATSSGVREAKRLLSVPAVTLGRAT